MPRGLNEYFRSYLVDPSSAKKELTVPLLVWAAPPKTQEEDFLLGTVSGLPGPRPTAQEALVFELRKAKNQANAFAMGITVGRTENNDVVLPDNSISRFHAYFQTDSKTQGWKLVDAESKYGTWVGALKLTPNQGAQLGKTESLRFGELKLDFYTPESFWDYLKSRDQ